MFDVDGVGSVVGCLRGFATVPLQTCIDRKVPGTAPASQQACGTDKCTPAPVDGTGVPSLAPTGLPSPAPTEYAAAAVAGPDRSGWAAL